MFRISNKTLVVYYNGSSTIMVNTDGVIVKHSNCLRSLLNISCIYYGSSLNGRIKGSKNLLECKYKLPIIISETNKIVFFPINFNSTEMWINFNMIKSFERFENNTIITFLNGYKKVVFVSYRVINNQILKCSRLWLEYLERK